MAQVIESSKEYLTSKIKKNKRCKFSNTYYVYDIESTKYEDGEVPIMAYSYLHGIKAYNFNSDMTKDNIEDYSYDYKPFRKNEDVYKYFYNLNLNAKEKNEKVLILVHNLTYEFYNAIFNIPELHRYLTENPNNIFAMSSTDILYVRIGNLEFRDTLKLFAKSLKICAESVGMKKNEENKTYNEIWTDNSKLPQWEYDYNEHDLDITATYFCKFVNLLKLQDDTINGFIKTKILTNTGMVRWTCGKINLKRDIQNQMLMVKESQQSINELIQDWIERYVFRGGFCKSIAFYTFRLNRLVHSIDFASSYPGNMVTASFPSGKIIESKNLVIELYEKLKNFSDKDFIDEYFNTNIYKPEKHFIFKAKLNRLKLKQRLNENNIPYISYDKSENIVGGLVCNGSVYSADSIDVSGTELDLILFCMYYNFELTEVVYEYTFEKSDYLTDYKIFSISSFAIEKEGFKKLENCKTIDEFEKMLNKTLYGEKTYKDIWNLTGLDYKEESFDKVIETCHTYLMNAKNKLNALYGIIVQHQFQQNISYKDYGFEVSETKDLKWNKKELYIQGVYVTAHARFRLLLMALKLAIDGMSLIYFDTDSIKCSGDIEVLKRNVEEWNKITNVLRDKIIKIFRQKGEEIFLSNFGNFDYEGTSDYFITQGSKRYLSVKNDKVKCTISGVNKKRTSQGMTIYYKKYGIEKLFVEWFGLNVLYDYNLSLRSINFIPKEPMLIKDVVIDDNGEKQVVEQFSCEGISERDCGYLLAGFEDFVSPNIFWYSFCELVRKDNVKVNTKPHTIKLKNMKFDDEKENLIDCDFIIEDGYTIDKYAENMIKYYEKYTDERKYQDFNDELHAAIHDYSAGFSFYDEKSWE